MKLTSDYRTCTNCRRLVDLGHQCTCEITQEHYQRVAARASHEARYPEQGLPDSDTQDMPIPMPSFPSWINRTLLLCIVFVVVGLMFCEGLNGMAYRGRADVLRYQAEADAINQQVRINERNGQ